VILKPRIDSRLTPKAFANSSLGQRPGKSRMMFIKTGFGIAFLGRCPRLGIGERLRVFNQVPGIVGANYFF
jgi:hypothetical protein